jgi:hypothetical protein
VVVLTTKTTTAMVKATTVGTKIMRTTMTTTLTTMSTKSEKKVALLLLEAAEVALVVARGLGKIARLARRWRLQKGGGEVPWAGRTTAVGWGAGCGPGRGACCSTC